MIRQYRILILCAAVVLMAVGGRSATTTTTQEPPTTTTTTPATTTIATTPATTTTATPTTTTTATTPVTTTTATNTATTTTATTTTTASTLATTTAKPTNTTTIPSTTPAASTTQNVTTPTTSKYYSSNHWRRKRGGGGGARYVCAPPPLLTPHFYFPLELYVYITLTNNYLAFFIYQLIILWTISINWHRWMLVNNHISKYNSYILVLYRRYISYVSGCPPSPPPPPPHTHFLAPSYATGNVYKSCFRGKFNHTQGRIYALRGPWANIIWGPSLRKFDPRVLDDGAPSGLGSPGLQPIRKSDLDLTRMFSRLLDPLTYFLFQPVLHDWCNKGRGMYYPLCGMVHIKEPLLLRVVHVVAAAGLLFYWVVLYRI